MPSNSKTVNTCIYVDWYKFHVCGITTCKNHNTITKSNCLAIDRVQPSGNTKIITDAELHFYKFSKEKISTRLVSLKRKKALTRIKILLTAKKYIEYINQNFSSSQKKEQTSEIASKFLRKFPLRVKRIKFEPWMWQIYIDEKVFQKFSESLDGEASEIKLHDVVGTTIMKLAALRNQIVKEESWKKM